jgi:cytokinesis protein
METLFGRKKSRPRMSSVSAQDLRSVPYESVPAGPPIPVSRPVTATSISAPATNPTLTTNGTNINIHTMQRSKAERERAYATTGASTQRSGSPHASLATDDSSTLYSESTDSISNPHTSYAARKLRQSGSSSGRRSPSIYDSVRALPPIPPTPSSPPPSASSSLRPASSSTTRSDNRSSRYTVQTEPHPHHNHYHFPSLHRHGTMDDFNFPRPDDDEIDAMFQNIVRTRDLTNLPPLSIDQKWSMVESDERLRWKDEKTREEQAKKIPEQSRNGMIEERSPEWYLMKFMDRSITPKDASGLLVSLRGHELGCVLHHSSSSSGLPNEILLVDDRWFQQFIAIQGTRVLTQFISYLSRKGKQRFVLSACCLFVCSTIVKDGGRPSAGIRDTSLYKADIELLGTSWSILLNVV